MAAVIVHRPVLTGGVAQRGEVFRARVRVQQALKTHRERPDHHAEIEVHLAVRALERLIRFPEPRKTPAPGGKSETRGSGGHEALLKIVGECDAGNSLRPEECATAQPGGSRARD